MSTRNPSLRQFLASLKGVFAAASLGVNAAAAIGRIEDALETPGAAGTAPARRLPVCRYLDDVFSGACAGSLQIASLTNAFATLEPSLAWAVRPSGGPFASDNWPDGHANATIVGPNGLEDRGDLSIGVSLLAPHVRYPDHNHGPEEVYLVLSPGRFQHGDSGWFAPGVGGTLYNEPNIKHAMVSDDAPLLAIWCLWIGKRG